MPSTFSALLRDRDALKTLIVAAVAVAATGGLWVVPYAAQVVRTARSAPVTPVRSRRVLLFGKRLAAGNADRDLETRVERAHALLAAGRVAEVLLLGGRHESDASEAEVAHRMLVERDRAHAARLKLEDASADTLENLRNARVLLDVAAREPVALLTSRYHLARCALLARQLGYDYELCAAEERFTWRHTMRALRETLLLCWIDTGARWARLTRNRRMLARIT